MQESSGKIHQFESVEEYQKKLKELGEDLLPLPKREGIVEEAKKMNRGQRRKYAKLLKRGFTVDDAFYTASEI